MARLALAKNTLGGLVEEEHLNRLHDSHQADWEAARARNWELLRNSAERAGLYFEPMQLDGQPDQFAVVWFPLDKTFDGSGVSLKKTWKLLQVKNPWDDPRLKDWQGYRQLRSFNAEGALLPRGEAGASQGYVAPLAVYSLTYSRQPLLLADFRSHINTKWREIFQRSWEDLATGVFALSHFTNWYYFAGTASYQFLRSRSGSATNSAQRLDSYADLRSSLALDQTLDPQFRKELEQRLGDLSINPFESSPGREANLARLQYAELVKAANEPELLPKRVNNERREEMASFGASTGANVRYGFAHYLTLGIYKRRAPQTPEYLATLDRQRRINASLKFLSRVADAGPSPEVMFGETRIQDSIDALSMATDAGTPAPYPPASDRGTGSRKVEFEQRSPAGGLRPATRRIALRRVCAGSPQLGRSAETTGPRGSRGFHPKRGSAMKSVGRALFLIYLLAGLDPVLPAQQSPARRIVILKVDGLGADLLANTMAATDPQTGRKQLPWLNRIFAEHGTLFEDFYTRGISLSAPSWSMLDTGNHLLIKGNVEYDRYTGRVYDYLNVFPFYWASARKRQVDAPSVEVLDDAGVPLLSDRFAFDQRFQTPQLFERGVRWPTLEHSLGRQLSANSLLLLLEDPSGGIGLEKGFAAQTEAELLAAIANPKIQYMDLFTGDLDHVAHSVNDRTALQIELAKLDALAGRVWTAIEATPLGDQTLFVLVSDHGMNNVPNVYSQTFSLPDLLNSPAGGAHHVVTDRPQLSPYKLQGLNPMLSWVNSPSTASFYLQGQGEEYPTAWLDMDGNERANVSLRNSDLNRVQILLQQLRRSDLSPEVRRAATDYLGQTLDRLRPHWQEVSQNLSDDLKAWNVVIQRARSAAQKSGGRASEDRERSGGRAGFAAKRRRTAAMEG